MDYQQTLDFMFKALPMYQRQGKSAFKKDLGNITAFCEYLANPEKEFKSIHVAGTNGKGSTSHMIAAMLQNAGLKVGLYTSPHLKDFRERIKISGVPIAENAVIEFVASNKDLINKIQPSFFEMTVAMAFDHFAKEKVDIAVIEVGLGGRLDSTNIIKPELSVITNIGYDHMEMLGDSLALIAAEKAGIIKSNRPVVIGEFQNETAPVFEKIAHTHKAPLVYAERIIKADKAKIPTDLKGAYQIKNKITALAALDQLNRTAGWDINLQKAEKGLSKVVELTGLKGRWQQLSKSPLVICDTGHNMEAFDYILPSLNVIDKNDLWMVMGFVNDKNVADLLVRLPKNARFVFTEAKIPRAMPIAQLKDLASDVGIEAYFIQNVNQAITFAKDKATQQDVVFVGGSTFVVAEINEL